MVKRCLLVQYPRKTKGSTLGVYIYLVYMRNIVTRGHRLPSLSRQLNLSLKVLDISHLEMPLALKGFDCFQHSFSYHRPQPKTLQHLRNYTLKLKP